MIGKDLVDIMKTDGVKIGEAEETEVVNALDIAARDGRLYFIEQGGITIGFASYIEKKDKIHLNYCFIYHDHRNRTNLLPLRKFFRSLKDNFTWRSRRRNKICKVK